MDTQRTGLEVAIIGMAGRFPGAPDLQTFWHNLCNGVESITFYTDEQLRSLNVDPNVIKAPNYVKAASVLNEIDQFDAAFFGYAPREARLLDPQHRLFLECAWEALENAGYTSDGYPGLIGVYAGTSLSSYLLFNLLSSPEIHATDDSFPVMVGNDKDFLSTRVSYNLNLRGPSITVQTGCSTSLVAIHLACENLITLQTDMALAGGISVNPAERFGYYYQEGGIVSPDGHCRAFDAEARGTIFGNGVGVVVLKRLEDALADGDTILAVIKGSAINNDGANKVGYTAPSVEGQAEVIARAQAMAEVDPETISYIEAHGTGTPLGDPIEIAALTKAFRVSTPQTGFCAIGSVKTNIGHLDAAAGIAGLIKTVLAMQHHQIPPSLHFVRPNPQIDFATSPFYVNATLSNWQTTQLPRRAGVSSFGIGGTNAHVILEEAPPAAPSEAPRHPAQLLLLSARTPSALATARANLAAHLAQHPELALADVAATLQLGRRAFRQRRALVVTDHAQAIAALRSDDPQAVSMPEALPQRPVVFLFPGQGAQYVGMGQDLYHSQPRFRAVVDQCAALLTPQIGLDLRSLLYPSGNPAVAAPRLADTDLGQVALFVVSYALAQQWLEWGVQPAAMIGHSLGEYVAACLAGVFSLEAGLRLVVQRGRLMQAQPRGAMLAVDLPAAVLAPRLPPDLTVAVETSAESCVVAGPSEAITALAATLTQEGVVHQPVATTHAFHSALMDGAMTGLTAAAATTPLAAPTIPYISTVSGTWITAAEATDARYWGRQLRAPVRLATGLATVASMDGAILLELGPGQMMSSLARRQRSSDQVVVASMRHRADARDDVVLLLEALGQFWVAGGTVDWARFHADQPRRRVPLPTYPFERQRYWIERSAVPEQSTRTATDKQPDIAKWFYVPSWQRTIVPRAATTASLASASGSWLVLMDEQGLGAMLVARLRAAGASVVAVQAGSGYAANEDGHYVVDPTAVADYQQLLHTLRAQGQVPSQILQLWGLASEGSEAIRQGLESMVALMQALGAEEERGAMRWWVIGREALEVESRDVVRPEQVLVLGPCRVIPQEYAGMRCHYVDVAVAPDDAAGLAQLADQVLAEVTSAADEPVVAYRGAMRWVQTYRQTPLDAETPAIVPLRQNGVYLITGGLGKVGLLIASYLAQTLRAKLILLSRTGLPSRDSWDTLLQQHAETDPVSRQIRKVQALEAAGAEVVIVQADVGDEQQMRSALKTIYQRFGALHGVIHAAGMAGSAALRLISEISPEERDQHFQAKVNGVQILKKVLHQIELDFCLLFSSNTAVLGGIGTTLYAAANLFMDAFVTSWPANAPGRWVSINWDPLLIEDGERHTAFRTSIDQYALEPAEIVEVFRRTVECMTTSRVVISAGNLDERIRLWLNPAQHTAQGNTAQSSARSTHSYAATTPFTPPESDVEALIAEIWQDELGIAQVGIDHNFFDLGGNSLIGLKILARLKKAFDTDLQVVNLFERPTIRDMAALIRQEQEDNSQFDNRRSRGERRRNRRQGKLEGNL